jgi:hypothetical protein
MLLKKNFSGYNTYVLNTNVHTTDSNQLVHFTTKVVSLNPTHGEVYLLDTTLCDKVCRWIVTGWLFSQGTPVSSTNKTDCHDIPVTEISGIKRHTLIALVVVNSTTTMKLYGLGILMCIVSFCNFYTIS